MSKRVPFATAGDACTTTQYTLFTFYRFKSHTHIFNTLFLLNILRYVCELIFFCFVAFVPNNRGANMNKELCRQPNRKKYSTDGKEPTNECNTHYTHCKLD